MSRAFQEQGKRFTWVDLDTAPGAVSAAELRTQMLDLADADFDSIEASLKLLGAITRRAGLFGHCGWMLESSPRAAKPGRPGNRPWSISFRPCRSLSLMMWERMAKLAPALERARAAP